ncbi:MAG TPA: RNB domain-containing ribonuclease [Steroidobacteraceae bacterium]|nr:RNB domain-containing ribonuclease [Steroidobacteraceae bacterium]
MNEALDLLLSTGRASGPAVMTGPNHAQLLSDIARQAMLERHLQPEFSAAALQALERLTQAADPTGPGLQDLRRLSWVSIDNDDSRDLDQLSVAEALDQDRVRVRVAIADVDALVRSGDAIDEHARINTTSVYTPAQVFPMLPPRLSTDLTSLGQSQTRIALVVDMVVDAAGALVGSDVYRAVVINQARLTYRRVSAWLAGSGTPPARISDQAALLEQLRLQQQVAERLRRVRQANGALRLASIEPQAVFDGQTLRDLRPLDKNIAMELIEDLMIAANGVTARFLSSRGIPSLRRVLRTPERWDSIVSLAAQLGESLQPEPSALALNALLMQRQRSDPSGFPDLCLAVIKLLGRGEYVVERPGTAVPGHFGLAVQDYTHATAPNRRFPDLITQRLLKAALGVCPSPYGEAELAALAAHCTVQEDNAAKVERRVAKSAAALLLQDRVGERFDAIVTGAAEKGTWVRIEAPMTEGRLMSGFEGMQVGDRLRVILASTDVARGFIDFRRAD